MWVGRRPGELGDRRRLDGEEEHEKGGAAEGCSLRFSGDDASSVVGRRPGKETGLGRQERRGSRLGDGQETIYGPRGIREIIYQKVLRQKEGNKANSSRKGTPRRPHHT